MAISMYISLSYSLPILQNPSITKTHFPFSPIHTPKSKICPRRKHFLIFAAENGGNNTENQENGLKNNGSSNGNGSNNGNGDGGGKPRLNLRWMDLLLDPDPDNIVAVGLTGLLTWASVSILWQLFVIALAILLAALKYSFIAALLIFILITLL
ncbi:hypothetical protein AABB24_019574 [Solanum stoloniferum]|uniref:Transmembrane protein n=1 Tax=Solanum stoloniferum TaxID=62892 RepID=A0ABD2TH56_9SOLN|nr:uncharacterized protein LOC125837103 [Solanum verrucosum]